MLYDPESEPLLSPEEKAELSRLFRLTPEEVAEELRAVGIDPHELARRLWEKSKAQVAAIEKERQRVKPPRRRAAKKR